MNAFLQAVTPESARALSLIGRHHGVVSRNGVAEFDGMEKSGPKIPWGKGAAANHLRASRRRVKIDDIPESGLPVILELGGGENFVILKESCEEDQFRVQFPDSREAMIGRNRLAGSYSGFAIFLRKRVDSSSRTRGPGGSGLLRRRRSSLRRCSREKSFRVTLAFNLIFLAMMLLMVGAHQYVYRGFSHQSWVLPLASIACGAAICVGLLRLRREWVRAGRFASAADFLVIPLFVGALCVFAGWSALPFAMVAVSAGLGFLLSGRFSFFADRSKRKKRAFLAGAFCLSSVMACGFTAEGLLSPAAITGSLVLTTYLVNLFINSDALWQSLGLGASG